MASGNQRVSVQTYVSADQRERWRREAEKMDMSQAEYVRSMVQAGRRGFEFSSEDGERRNPAEPGFEDETAGVDGLKHRVLDVLRTTEFAGWDTLLAGVTDDIEERLEGALEELQAEGRIRYSGRHGGYTVIEDER